MRKFKIKNRQKRKYTRHNQQNDALLSSPITASIMPFVILAVAFGTMALMHMNLREQTVSFQPTSYLPEFTWSGLPQLSVPSFPSFHFQFHNPFVQPLAWITGSWSSFISGMQASFAGLTTNTIWSITLPNPSGIFMTIGAGVQNVFHAIGVIGIQMFEGFIRVGELLVQSLSTVAAHMAAGAQTVGSATIEYATRAADIISSSVAFLFAKTVQVVVFLYNGLVSILTFVASKIADFLTALGKLIILPFQILGSLWIQIKPYVDILLHHFGMAGQDLKQGVDSMNAVGSSLQQ